MIATRWQPADVLVHGIRLHLRRLVVPAAAPILLVHGLGVTGGVWQSFGRRLAPSYAATAPDLRGHGQSDAPSAGYEPGDYAADLSALWPAVLDRPAPVIGHSLGALVALALAASQPALVPAVMLLDPPLDPRRRNPDIANVRRLKHEPPAALDQYLLSTNGGSQVLARTLAAQFRQAADAAFDALLTAPVGHPAAWALAPSVTQPTLLVRADPDHGGVLGDQAARSFAALLPRGQLHSIPGAPHAVHASHPDELATTILRFLAAACG